MAFFPSVPQAVNNLGVNPTILTLQTQLTAEQIRSLNTVPVTIVNGAVGVWIIPLWAVMMFQAATPPVPFSVGTVTLTWFLGNSEIHNSAVNPDGTESEVWWDDDFNVFRALSGGAEAIAHGWVGAALTLTSSEDFPSGEGTLYVLVTYLSVSVAPPLTSFDYPITAVNQGTKTFTAQGDATVLAVGLRITVAGSTGNDGDYTVVTFTITPGVSTDIVVSEAIPDATADGVVIVQV